MLLRGNWFLWRVFWRKLLWGYLKESAGLYVCTNHSVQSDSELCAQSGLALVTENPLVRHSQTSCWEPGSWDVQMLRPVLCGHLAVRATFQEVKKGLNLTIALRSIPNPAPVWLHISLKFTRGVHASWLEKCLILNDISMSFGKSILL